MTRLQFQRAESSGQRLRSSEHLAHSHGGYCREESDPKSREGILALGHSEGGDHTGPEAGHGQLGDEFTAGLGIGTGQHGETCGFG
jgi:hypothetical protein